MEPIQLELPTIFEGMTVNAWLFLEPEPTLIDCGEKTDKLWDSLEKQLNINGLGIKDLKKVIITHAHLDHIGMARKITEHSDAEIWVNEYVYDWAIDLKTMLDRRTDAIFEVLNKNLSKKYSKKYFDFGWENLADYWDEIPVDRLKVFPMEGKLNFGGNDWDIIYTPGHCINQTCFYNPSNGYFISADMLLRIIPSPIIDASLTPPFSRVKSLVMHLKSYEKIAQLKISKCFPGHFDAFENAHTLISKQVQKIQSRKENCFTLIQNGIRKVIDLTKAIYPNRVNNATIFMVIGFLDILMEENRIESIEVDGLFHYYEKVSIHHGAK